jgi:hypothetical protein
MDRNTEIREKGVISNNALRALLVKADRKWHSENFLKSSMYSGVLESESKRR